MNDKNIESLESELNVKENDISNKVVSRGNNKEDKKSFSEESVKKLRYAQEEVLWLLDRGYPLNTIIDLVGGRYQFTARQRIALQRATSSTNQCNIRKEKQLHLNSLSNERIHIDGFNFIITMEVALSNGLLIKCKDGAIRDLAGLRGTYKLIDKTDKALEVLGKIIKAKNIPEICFWLDSPVSNSGRLKTFIYEKATTWNIPVHVELVPNADVILEKKERVVTSDAIILDKCVSWINLVDYALKEFIDNTNTIKLDI